MSNLPSLLADATRIKARHLARIKRAKKLVKRPVNVTPRAVSKVVSAPAVKLNAHEIANISSFSLRHYGCSTFSSTPTQCTVTSSPTGIGRVVTVSCDECGKYVDVTDYESW